MLEDNRAFSPPLFLTGTKSRIFSYLDTKVQGLPLPKEARNPGGFRIQLSSSSFSPSAKPRAHHYIIAGGKDYGISNQSAAAAATH